MKFFDCIGIKEKDVVSIVGAGGKTSLMFQLAKELKSQDRKILITTTTKIYAPQREDADEICACENSFFQYALSEKKGIYVFGTQINTDNKLIGLSKSQLERVIKYFDYVIIEADGSKEKPLKGWSNTEPVIYAGTTKTIGVLDIQALGRKICTDHVFRIEQFCEIANARQGEMVLMEHLVNMIAHPKGLFKDAVGDKILMINKTDDIDLCHYADQLAEKISTRLPRLLSRIVIGSIEENKCYISQK